MFPDHPLAKAAQKLRESAMQEAGLEEELAVYSDKRPRTASINSEASADAEVKTLTKTPPVARKTPSPDFTEGWATRDTLSHAALQCGSDTQALLEAQRRESEATRKLEALRHEHAEAKLRAELALAKDREEQQRRELEKQQREAERKRAELELKQLETEHKRRETELLGYYNTAMASGSSALAGRNYTFAIHDYKRALGYLVDLQNAHSAYTRKVHGLWHPETYPYKDFTTITNLAIANATYLAGHIKEAYSLLQQLEVEQHKPHYQTLVSQRQTCSNAIYEQAIAELRSVAQLNIKDDPSVHPIAKAKLKVVKANLDLINVAYPIEYSQLVSKLGWYETRQSTASRTTRALETKLPLSDYAPLESELRSLIAAYKLHHEFLTAEESASFHELNELHLKVSKELELQRERERLERERVADIAAQKEINANLRKVYNLLQIGDIPAALVTLKDAQELSRRVYNPSNINTYMPLPGEAALSYTAPEFFSESLRLLEREALLFEARRREYVCKIIDEIIDTTLQQISLAKIQATGIHFQASLFEPHRQTCEGLLKESLTALWHRFDLRSGLFHKALIQRMVEALLPEITEIGVVNRWWGWSYASSQFKDHTLIAGIVSKTISEIDVATGPESVLQLPIFAAVVTSPQATVVEPPFATRVEHESVTTQFRP